MIPLLVSNFWYKVSGVANLFCKCWYSLASLPIKGKEEYTRRIHSNLTTAMKCMVITQICRHVIMCYPGQSAYSDWLYCVNYTTVDVSNMKSNCTRNLQIRLSSLDNDTLYKLRVSAIGPGGERATPNEFLFRTKPAGKMM